METREGNWEARGGWSQTRLGKMQTLPLLEGLQGCCLPFSVPHNAGCLDWQSGEASGGAWQTPGQKAAGLGAKDWAGRILGQVCPAPSQRQIGGWKQCDGEV